MNTELDITDKNYKPSIEEISNYVANPLFDRLYNYMNTEYKALHEIAYSGDKVLLGWNIKLSKAGRALCRLYPNKGSFNVLIVIGKKEKDRTEDILPELSDEMQKLYNNTKEGMGQRWLVFELKEYNGMYEDLLKLIHIRRYNK